MSAGEVAKLLARRDLERPGSAVRGTLADLASCGAQVAAIGTLAQIWRPADCPLCARGAALE